VQPQQPAGLDAPNLKVTIPETDGASWRSWFNKFVVDGNNGTENEKNGQLDLVSRSGKTLATLKLQNLGIFRLTPTPADGHDAQVARLTAEMYCERIDFNFPS